MTAAIHPLPVPPVVKELRLACTPAEAFRRFTEDIHLWWPTATHSLNGPAGAHVAFETREGGRLFERGADGIEHTWGTVAEWQPPSRLAFSWHVGRAADTAQRVELDFLPDGAGTRVRLVHSGWERLGEDARRLRDNYDGGWDLVFGRGYGAHAAKS